MGKGQEKLADVASKNTPLKGDEDNSDIEVSNIMMRGMAMAKQPFNKLVGKPKVSSLTSLRAKLKTLEGRSTTADKWEKVISLAAGVRSLGDPHTLKKKIRFKEDKLKKKNKQRGLRALNAKKLAARAERMEKKKSKRPASKEARLGGRQRKS